jgi:hypothetical protein
MNIMSKAPLGTVFNHISAIGIETARKILVTAHIQCSTRELF